jgi:beta-lactamase regulating signal transducer with metallopeptidase domain
MTPLVIVVKATILVAIAQAGTRALRAARASVRHAVLASLFGVLLLLPIAAALAPPVPIAIGSSQMADAAPGPFLKESESPIQYRPGARTDAPAVLHGGGASAAFIERLTIAIWATGAVLFLVPIITGLRQLRTARRRGRPSSIGRPLLQRLAADVRIRRSIDLLVLDEMAAPMTCGSLHPAIVLPAQADRWRTTDSTSLPGHPKEPKSIRSD